MQDAETDDVHLVSDNQHRCDTFLAQDRAILVVGSLTRRGALPPRRHQGLVGNLPAALAEFGAARCYAPLISDDGAGCQEPKDPHPGRVARRHHSYLQPGAGVYARHQLTQIDISAFADDAVPRATLTVTEDLDTAARRDTVDDQLVELDRVAVPARGPVQDRGYHRGKRRRKAHDIACACEGHPKLVIRPESNTTRHGAARDIVLSDMSVRRCSGDTEASVAECEPHRSVRARVMESGWLDTGTTLSSFPDPDIRATKSSIRRGDGTPRGSPDVIQTSPSGPLATSRVSLGGSPAIR